MSKDHHLKHGNVTKTYQKAPPQLEASTNLEAKSKSTKLKISDRVESKNTCFCDTQRPQDHFCFSTTCRLINQAKNHSWKSE